jgi:platelet-activating factor acetylhydrolase IB subunit beta/gamma
VLLRTNSVPEGKQMQTEGHERPDIFDSIERSDEHHVERHSAILKRIKEGPIDLLFLGDSIIRRWAEYPDLWVHYFSQYNPANFGVGSDTIQNLKWRILNGELEGIKPGVIVLMIGTNNLSLYSGSEISQAIQHIVEIIHDRLPDSTIVLMGILPRNPDDTVCDYMKIISYINSELSQLEKFGYVHFLDIGEKFIGADGKVIEYFMPDGIHLVEPGYKIWGELLLPVIKKNMPR